MQVTIIPMPQPHYMMLDRRRSITPETFMRQIEPRIYPFDEPNPHAGTSLILGSEIKPIEQALYKVVHISHDQQWAFETVYAHWTNGMGAVCLYSKIIQYTVDITTSLMTIDLYRTGNETLIPVTDLVDHFDWSNAFQRPVYEFHTLIPPIYDSEALDQEVIRRIDESEESVFRQSNTRLLRRLYDQEPALMEALISGRFVKSPHLCLQQAHPFVQFPQQNWSLLYQMQYRKNAYGGKVYYNCPEFDAIVLDIMRLRASEFSISLSFQMALEGHIDHAIVNSYCDPYDLILPLGEDHRSQIHVTLRRLFADCLWLYTSMFDLDFTEIIAHRQISHITLSKSCGDEVLIEFRDFYNDHHIAFFTSFAPLSLATQGVGTYNVLG